MSEKVKITTIDDIGKSPDLEWRVVGVDPAPSKKSVVCYSSNRHLVFKQFNAQQLYEFLELCKDKDSQVLLVWDAPLTGPPLYSAKEERKYAKGDFTQRDIEKFFMKKEYKHKPPTGINTQGYSGCQHWTITKTFTGLPLLGDFCKQKDLPFHHIVSNGTECRNDKPNIVEVHPALAIYIWIKYSELFSQIENWQYKKDKLILKNLFDVLIEVALKVLPVQIDFSQIESDDHFDAFIAWALGYLYVAQDQNQPKVSIMGNEKTGSMLLPYEEELLKMFNNEFLQD